MNAEAMGLRIAILRDAAGWSQSGLAHRLTGAGFEGAHQATISRIEKGDRPLRVFEAYMIADLFGITIDQLAGRSPVAPMDGAAGLREAIQILNDELNRRSA